MAQKEFHVQDADNAGVAAAAASAAVAAVKASGVSGSTPASLVAYGTFVAALGVAAGAFPSLAKWGEAVSLDTLGRTAEGDWAGGLLIIKPGAIVLASGMFNMVVLALVVTSGWTKNFKKQLVFLALGALVAGSLSSWWFYSSYDSSQARLVAEAAAMESASAAGGAPKVGAIRAAVAAKVGRSAGTEMFIGFPYAMWFALWTLSLALFSEKYRLSRHPRNDAATE
jgi:hypothetical protein